VVLAVLLLVALVRDFWLWWSRRGLPLDVHVDIEKRRSLLAPGRSELRLDLPIHLTVSWRRRAGPLQGEVSAGFFVSPGILPPKRRGSDARLEIRADPEGTDPLPGRLRLALREASSTDSLRLAWLTVVDIATRPRGRLRPRASVRPKTPGRPKPAGPSLQPVRLGPEPGADLPLRVAVGRAPVLRLANPNDEPVRLSPLRLGVRPAGFQVRLAGTSPESLPPQEAEDLTVRLESKNPLSMLPTRGELEAELGWAGAADAGESPVRETFEFVFEEHGTAMEVEVPLETDGAAGKGTAPLPASLGDNAVEPVTWLIDAEGRRETEEGLVVEVKAAGGGHGGAELEVEDEAAEGQPLRPRRLDVPVIVRGLTTGLPQRRNLEVRTHLTFALERFRVRARKELQRPLAGNLRPLQGFVLDEAIAAFELAVVDHATVDGWVQQARQHFLAPIGKALIDYFDNTRRVSLRLDERPYRHGYEAVYRAVCQVLRELAAGLEEPAVLLPDLDSEHVPATTTIWQGHPDPVRMDRSHPDPTQRFVFWTMQPGREVGTTGPGRKFPEVLVW